MDSIDIQSSLPAGESLSKLIGKTNQGNPYEATPAQVGAAIGNGATLITSKPSYLMALDGSGNPQKVTPDNLFLSEESTDADLKAIMDGIFITYYRKSDDFPVAVPWWSWKSSENSGEVADGVLVLLDGQAPIVVSVNDISAGMHWSTASTSAANISSGATVIGSSYPSAYADYSGKTKCATILAHSVLGAESAADNAVVACSQYTRPNANGKGHLAGSWWLPSIGELLMIWKHKYAINKALAQISGADQFAEASYWSSSETSATNAWYLYFSSGTLSNGGPKATRSLHVRAVSAWH